MVVCGTAGAIHLFAVARDGIRSAVINECLQGSINGCQCRGVLAQSVMQLLGRQEPA